MKRPLVLAALLAAAPAFAQTSTIQAQSAGSTQTQIAKEQSSVGTSNGTGATGAAAGATIGTKPVCTPSTTALTDCALEPASGVRNPGIVTNSLDATGTFSTTPSIVTPLNESVDARNMGGVSASGTAKKP